MGHFSERDALCDARSGRSEADDGNVDELDIYNHFGTEYLTGAGVGPWYSVNDYAMSRMAKEYLRWTGDKAWLDKEVNGKKVLII